MTELSDQTIKKIEEKNIKPKPRWCYACNNYFSWSAVVLLIVSGALILATIVFMVLTDDWDLYRYTGASPVRFFLMSVPYFWLILLALVLFLASLAFSFTKNGYHYQRILVVAGVFVVCLALGLILFSGGFGPKPHELLSNVPFYQNLVYFRENIWNDPDDGLLAGQILTVSDSNSFIIRDISGKIWQIEANNLSPASLLLIRPGVKVKMIGKEQGSAFDAQEIRPWTHYFWDSGR